MSIEAELGVVRLEGCRLSQLTLHLECRVDEATRLDTIGVVPYPGNQTSESVTLIAPRTSWNESKESLKVKILVDNYASGSN